MAKKAEQILRQTRLGELEGWLLGMPDWLISGRIRPVKHLNLRLPCDTARMELLKSCPGLWNPYNHCPAEQLEIMPFEKC